MSEDARTDAVPEIVASGREITRDDVEMLWSDLISARYTWQETSERALALIETVNVPEHIVNWGLMDLYYLWWPGAARDVESYQAMREAWWAKLREYDAEQVGWDHRYYREMVGRHAAEFGDDKAACFGRALVASGLLEDSDIEAALQGFRGATGAVHKFSGET